MLYDKKIIELVKQINKDCLDYITFVEELNECASTDRKLESIINKCKILEEYHLKRFNENVSKENIPINNNFEFEILNFWDDYNDLYVDYIVTDNNANIKVHAARVYDISDIDKYHNSSESEIENQLCKLIKKDVGYEFNLPKVSELSPLLKYIYNNVCENESNMCHIDDNDWQELCEEKNFTANDIKNLKEEIKKYDLEDYVTIDTDGYKICCYGGLQCCFNDDERCIDDKLER